MFSIIKGQKKKTLLFRNINEFCATFKDGNNILTLFIYLFINGKLNLKPFFL